MATHTHRHTQKHMCVRIDTCQHLSETTSLDALSTHGEWRMAVSPSFALESERDDTKRDRVCDITIKKFSSDKWWVVSLARFVNIFSYALITGRQINLAHHKAHGVLSGSLQVRRVHIIKVNVVASCYGRVIKSCTRFCHNPPFR